MPVLTIDTQAILNTQPEFKGQYRFYAWLSQQISGSLIVDVGTARGLSAKAFATNPTNLVITYDTQSIEERGALARLASLDNVVWKQLGCNNVDPQWFSHVDIICLDIDPHDGIQEEEFLKRIEPHFKGLLVMDDINKPERWGKLYELFNGMEHWLLPNEIGAETGTGLITYGDWTVEAS